MFSIGVMVLVALIAFSTVVAVMYVGTREGDAPPHLASDSHAVTAWNERIATHEKRLAEQQAKAEAENTAD